MPFIVEGIIYVAFGVALLRPIGTPVAALYFMSGFAIVNRVGQSWPA